jgi:hypothetical protein
MRRVILLLAIVALGSCTHVPIKPKPLSAALTQADLLDAPAYKRAWELLSVINVGTRNSINDYLTNNAAASIHDTVDFFLMVHRDTIRLNVEQLEKVDKPSLAKLLLRSEVTGLPMNFSVTVDKEPPHKITSFNLDFAEFVPQDSEKINTEQAAQELKTFLSKICQADMFSGSVLLAKNNKVLFQGACGEANKDFNVPNNIATKFNLGSMNKMFTAVAIAQLVEQGKLSFDDPLSKFMPDFPTKNLPKR